MAAERAKKYQFDYISFKPFLTRKGDNNAEVIELLRDQHLEQVVATIREQVDIAKELADRNGSPGTKRTTNSAESRKLAQYFLLDSARTRSRRCSAWRA